ncbi:MAG: hypothetical protein AAFO81_09645 [Pseudomonadota bacterium]
MGGKEFPRQKRLIALIDQVFYAGTNFGLTMLLVVLANIETLGRFALVASVSALLHSVFVGVVLEPLTVFGSHENEHRVRAVYSHFGSLVSFVCLFFAGLLYLIGQDGYIGVFALGLAMFGAQSAVLCGKRIALIENGVLGSLVISVRYALGAVAVSAAAFFCCGYDERSLVAAVILASILACGYWWARALWERASIQDFLNVASKVRSYTTWTLASSVPSSVSAHGVYWIAEVASTQAVVGLLKLCEQLVMPLGQLLMTMSILDQIESAAEFRAEKRTAVQDRITVRTWAYMKLTALYFACLAAGLLAYSVIIGRVSAGFMVALCVYGLIALLNAFSIPRNVAAKACRRPDFVATAYLLTSVTICVVGFSWKPDGLVHLTLILLLGWVVHAASLQRSVSSLFVSR